jgi:hypothetical protein
MVRCSVPSSAVLTTRPLGTQYRAEIGAPSVKKGVVDVEPAGVGTEVGLAEGAE